MLRKCLLVALLLLIALFLPMAGTAASAVNCFRQCMNDAGCPPGSSDPNCSYIAEGCRCFCGPPQWCP